MQANEVIAFIKTENESMQNKIWKSKKDLDAVLIDIKHELNISVYLENTKLIGPAFKLMHQKISSDRPKIWCHYWCRYPVPGF